MKEMSPNILALIYVSRKLAQSAVTRTAKGQVASRERKAGGSSLVLGEIHAAVFIAS